MDPAFGLEAFACYGVIRLCFDAKWISENWRKFPNAIAFGLGRTVRASRRADQATYQPSVRKLAPVPAAPVAAPVASPAPAPVAPPAPKAPEVLKGRPLLDEVERRRIANEDWRSLLREALLDGRLELDSEARPVLPGQPGAKKKGKR